MGFILAKRLLGSVFWEERLRWFGILQNKTVRFTFSQLLLLCTVIDKLIWRAILYREWPYQIYNLRSYDLSTLALFPARMREISSPRLKAWLKSRRDWNVETNGNQDKMAIGANMSMPIPASYIRANSRTESHTPKSRSSLFQAIASCCITKEW